jgi:hypothetical protein
MSTSRKTVESRMMWQPGINVQMGIQTRWTWIKYVAAVANSPAVEDWWLLRHAWSITRSQLLTAGEGCCCTGGIGDHSLWAAVQGLGGDAQNLDRGEVKALRVMKHFDWEV